MGMDIWGMYNGCRVESKEFVYPILRIDYDILNNDVQYKKFNNVKIIRDSSLFVSGHDLKKSVYVREACKNRLQVGDFEWVNVPGFKNVRVEVVELASVTHEVPVFNKVDDILWEVVQSYHDKELLYYINLFNDIYYENRTDVLNFTDRFEPNEMSLRWWTSDDVTYVFNNIFIELNQDDVDYLLTSIDEFTERDDLRGMYSRFFDALREDVLTNRTSYVIDAS